MRIRQRGEGSSTRELAKRIKGTIRTAVSNLHRSSRSVSERWAPNRDILRSSPAQSAPHPPFGSGFFW
ncbi:hypothetical protein RSOLAG1IB_08012 [Rhizoctonia solani AG-1 IB]|uniref:Uncharacterized protein n=1 Tax=Thanatephorus cucumeris (strain AG1-IB / isolate 7/3/14) TaxID=1108050 RepID=A0A0B7FF96_THACB|nr:hypothetical protein RSOLAG1IB_08012 [Rhizoctonia solani AG-1 IB]